MVAYKDAIRHHVCIGDKVLAPWQNDGRYGPGTVLDGVDRRDVQPQGTYFYFVLLSLVVVRVFLLIVMRVFC